MNCLEKPLSASIWRGYSQAARHLKSVLSCVAIGAACLVAASDIYAQANDKKPSIHVYIDCGGSMQEGEIMNTAAAILPGEIEHLLNGRWPEGDAMLREGTRILVDVYYEKSSALRSEQRFTYIVDTKQLPVYEQLTKFTEPDVWFESDETPLDLLVGRNAWPGDLNNEYTFLIILTNSVKSYSDEDLKKINSQAENINSKVRVVKMPRNGEYKGDSLKMYLNKEIGGALSEATIFFKPRPPPPPPPTPTFYNLTVKIAQKESGTTNPAVGTTVKVETGKPFPISATANTAWKFTGWTSKGQAKILKIDSPSTTVILSGDADIQANFSKGDLRYSLMVIVNPPGGGTTTPDDGMKIKVAKDADFPITAIPSAGWFFVEWTTNSSATFADPKSPSSTVTLTGDATIQANFMEAPKYKLTVVVSPSEGGTTTPAAGTIVDVDGLYKISATASPGWTFKDWGTIDSAAIVDPNSTSTAVTLMGDATVQANFITEPPPPTKYKLTLVVTPKEGGKTSPSTDKVLEVIKGEKVSISATPASGWNFSGWKATGLAKITQLDTRNTMVVLTGNATVTANFSFGGGPPWGIILFILLLGAAAAIWFFWPRLKATVTFTKKGNAPKQEVVDVGNPLSIFNSHLNCSQPLSLLNRFGCSSNISLRIVYNKGNQALEVQFKSHENLVELRDSDNVQLQVKAEVWTNSRRLGEFIIKGSKAGTDETIKIQDNNA